MTGIQLKAIRERLGLSAAVFGRSLGYKGRNVGVNIRRLERGERPIPTPIARLAHMFWMNGIPAEWRA